MHVISQKVIKEFGKKYSTAVTSLAAWFKLIKSGHFQNFVELKRTFASVDMVNVKGNRLYVFNIGGHKFRLISAIHFNRQKLFVRQILTHTDYDTGDWKK